MFFGSAIGFVLCVAPMFGWVSGQVGGRIAGVVASEWDAYGLSSYDRAKCAAPVSGSSLEMSEALIVSDTGRVTPGLQAFVAARGYRPISTLINDRPEHERYYLSPATLEAIEHHSTDQGRDDLTVVLDGRPHSGQLADVQERLDPQVVDTPRLVWERLANENPVASARIELRTARLAHRNAADAQRETSAQGPSGTSGRLADAERRIQACRDVLADRQEAARERVLESHTGADARVVLLGYVGAPTTALWTALTGADATPEVGRPAQATTAMATIGPHRLAVTDTPSVTGDGGLPAWFLEVVPGASAALAAATCVLLVGDGHSRLRQAIADRFDTSCRSVQSGDAATAQSVVAEFLATTTFAIRLPYTDDAHALVSELHDQTVVHTVEYDDAIRLRVEVAQTAIGNLRRRVRAADGTVRSLSGSA